MPRSPLAPASFPAIPAIDGVKFASAETGVKYKGRPDLMLAVLSSCTQVAGVLTQSSTASAPVKLCRAALKNGYASALIVNAGNANAFTGKLGDVHARAMAHAVGQSLTCPAEDVLVASTGVIGETLPCDQIIRAIPQMVEQADKKAWHEAAMAIRTTDTFSKGAYRQVNIGNKSIRIAGIAKGSGMVAPNMATTLGFIFTDADIKHELLQSLLLKYNDKTFNCITVDGDTSTSDTLLLFATGQSNIPISRCDTDALTTFSNALEQVLQDLAIQIVRDGEGASKLITVNVTGAKSTSSARCVGLSIANSPLVKTAIAGEDANWGRIVMAVGKAGEPINQNCLRISIGAVLVTDAGQQVAEYKEDLVNTHLKGQEIDVHVDLGIGDGHACVWSCDLTHDYIAINADYRS